MKGLLYPGIFVGGSKTQNVDFSQVLVYKLAINFYFTHFILSQFFFNVVIQSWDGLTEYSRTTKGILGRFG